MKVKKDIHYVGYDLFTAQGHFYENDLTLFFDTGTNYTILKKNLINEIKSSQKNIKIKNKFGKFLKKEILYANKVNLFLEKNYTHPSRVVFFDGINNFPFEMDGILGFEYLYNIGFKVNFKEKSLILNPEKIEGNEIKLKINDYIPKIEVTINNCTFSMIIDTGSSSSSMEENDWKKLINCGSTELYSEEVYTSNTWQAMHERKIEKGNFEINVGGEKSKISLSKSHGPHSKSNFLGNDFLKNYEITIPKKSKYIYMKKI